MPDKSLTLAVDMYGCPNRCRHCWIGHMPNRKMEENADIWLINYFKPYFHNITYYSWLREPDYCNDYARHWQKDNQISVHTLPERFELASVWRIARDLKYVVFLKEAIPALNLARSITLKELVKKYGNKQSDKVFFIDDYKSYLLNCYIEERLG